MRQLGRVLRYYLLHGNYLGLGIRSFRKGLTLAISILIQTNVAKDKGSVNWKRRVTRCATNSSRPFLTLVDIR